MGAVFLVGSPDLGVEEEIDLMVFDGEIVQANNIWMIKRLKYLCLMPESFPQALTKKIGLNNLDTDVFVEVAVLGFIDLAKTALPDKITNNIIPDIMWTLYIA
jgi:hypothetical protein